MELNSRNIYIDKIKSNLPHHEGSLTGKKFSIKDCYWHNGRQPTLGIDKNLLSQINSSETAQIILNLQNLGAVPTAFTNMYPLAAGITGENPWHGDVISPYKDKIVLGSTSGGALSVASGDVDFALGSDSGGSIRAPAASCGVCGFTSRLCGFSHDGMIHHGDEIDGPSFITRDLDGMYELLSGLNCLDKGGDSLKKILLLTPEDLIVCDSNTRSYYETLSKKLYANLDIPIDIVSLNSYFEEALHIRKDLVIFELQKQIRTYFREISSIPNLFQAIMKLHVNIDEANFKLAKFKERLLGFVGENFCIITPTLPITPMSNDQANNCDLNFYLALANLLPSHALCFPSKLNSSFSVQIITNSSVKSLISLANKI